MLILKLCPKCGTQFVGQDHIEKINSECKHCEAKAKAVKAKPAKRKRLRLRRIKVM